MIRVLGVHGIGNYRYFRDLGSARAASTALGDIWSGWLAVPRGGLGQRFDGVEDAADVVIGTWDFHSAEGYLRCPGVARRVAC